MAYTPINWQTGDTITAEKMNKMDNGWSYTAGSGTEICNESVTTEDDGYGLYAGELSVGATADTIAVTFDNAEYTCAKIDNDYYGAPFDEETESYDWSEYPFVVFTDGYVVTQTAGTHTFIIAEVSAPTVETSTEFQAAVTSIADTSMMPMLCVSGTTTIQEMAMASNNGRLLYFKPYYGSTNTCIITDFVSDTVNYIPTYSGVTATFTNGVFTVFTN